VTTERRVTCWQCGRKLPEEQVIRRTVNTGFSAGRYPRWHYGRRNICQDCLPAIRRSERIWWAVTLIALAGIAVGVVVLFLTV